MKNGLTWVVGIFAILLGAAKVYLQWPLRVVPVDLAGKTIIVTGSSAGIGKEAARVFAQWNATVILACRNKTKALSILEDIQQSTGNPNVEVWELDLASFRSVREFAKRYIESGRPLHILVNNAGLIMYERRLTEDNHELTYQSNHLGHFLLTNLLLERIKESAPSRIVHVSSMLHYLGKIDFDDLELEQSYNSDVAYQNSKLMNCLFSAELQSRIEGTGVTSVSLHPGLVVSEIRRDWKGYMEHVNYVMENFFARTTEQGGLTLVYAATELSLKGGEYLDNNKVTAPHSDTTNKSLAVAFWEVSKRDVAL